MQQSDATTLRFAIFCATFLAGAGLTFVFWLPLWQGSGFVGGDVYSYYYPQKVFYAEQLQAGKFPLWNNRAGFGYPLIGESQTGVFYPPHLLFYRVLDINSAYNANHLLHYILTFVFTALFARRLGLKLLPAWLCGLVYTYAWFPPRNCVEWAIIGGAWLPAALWCAESFLQTRRWRFAIGLSIVLALQMLAGHFQIAFITQLLLVAYVPIRLWIGGDGSVKLVSHCKWQSAAVIAVFVGFSFGLAAIQLLPTWELKQLSQRRSPGQHHELSFGSIPVWYWSQIVRPWHWYSPLTDRKQEFRDEHEATGVRTNQVEAHLYFGLVPLILALCGAVRGVRTTDGTSFTWLTLGLLALCYTPGWFLPLTEHLPGFSFFQGPGRFGIVTTFAVAILAGRSFQNILSSDSLIRSAGLILGISLVAAVLSQVQLIDDVNFFVGKWNIADPLTLSNNGVPESVVDFLAVVAIILVIVAVLLGSGEINFRRRPSGRIYGSSLSLVPAGKALLGCCLFAITISDFWLVSRLVNLSPIVRNPPITFLSDSPVRIELSQYDGEVRLFAPGANFPTVLGCASIPVYLTFGPEQYTVLNNFLPEFPDSESDHTFAPPSKEQIDCLKRAGVTHILSFKPLDETAWSSKQIWIGIDPVLNRVWARSGELLYLYQLQGTRGRVGWTTTQPEATARIVDYGSNEVIIETKSRTAGRLVLTELLYPGWTVTVNGIETDGIEVEGLFRGVQLSAGAQTVIWTYSPSSLYCGAFISGAAAVILAVTASVQFWYPPWINFLGTDQQRLSDD